MDKSRKLRNKKTGEIGYLLATKGLERYDIVDDNYRLLARYDFLVEVSNEWEDYEPVEPLIEDQKTRKVFREWADLFGAKRFRVDHLCKLGRTIITSIDLVEEPEIGLPGCFGIDSETYTKVELCGDERE